MPFELEHWKNPRGTIANRFEHNDIAYATHGALQVIETLQFIDKPLSELKGLTLLDYGCGTGRAARLFSRIFAHAYGYDPVPECIALTNECAGIEFHNVSYSTDITTMPVCDMAVSMNVMEHLDAAAALKMIEDLKEHVAGLTYLWYSVRRNGTILAPYLTPEQVKEDEASSDSKGGDSIMVRAINFRALDKAK